MVSPVTLKTLLINRQWVQAGTCIKEGETLTIQELVDVIKHLDQPNYLYELSEFLHEHMCIPEGGINDIKDEDVSMYINAVIHFNFVVGSCSMNEIFVCGTEANIEELLHQIIPLFQLPQILGCLAFTVINSDKIEQGCRVLDIYDNIVVEMEQEIPSLEQIIMKNHEVYLLELFSYSQRYFSVHPEVVYTQFFNNADFDNGYEVIKFLTILRYSYNFSLDIPLLEEFGGQTPRDLLLQKCPQTLEVLEF